MVGEQIQRGNLPRLQIGQTVGRRGLLFRHALQRALLRIEALLGEDDPPRRALVEQLGL